MQNNKVIPTDIEIRLESPVFNTFRCQTAANSLDIDVNKKSVHELKINNINIPDNWNIGLVYGASGSGKTTMIKKLFGDNIFNIDIDENLPIIEQLPEDMNYDECAAILGGIGLTSVPTWIRPLKTLSNGQRARAEAALLMTKSKDVVFIDEFTSVVDRTVAKAMSVCIYKFAKRYNKKVVLLSCHYDILEWLKPDWLIDCNKQEFFTPQSEDFFFKEREKLEFTIREVDKSTWRMFSKYHYLSEKLAGGKSHYFGLFCGKDQIGFQAFSNYVPKRKGKKEIMHFNRTVIHPDYVGLGLGLLLINKTADYLLQHYKYNIMGKFSSIPVYKLLKKDPDWKLIRKQLVFGDESKSVKNIGRGKTKTGGGLRDKGIKTYTFKYK